MPAAGGFGRIGRYLLVGSDRVLRIPVAILVSGLASRALGVEDFGLYTSVLVLLAVVTPLASFGLESLGIAMASRSRDAATYLRSLVSFRLFTGVGAALLFLAAALVYFAAVMDRVAVLALAAVGSVLLMRMYELGENLLFAQERLAMLALVRISAFLAANLAIVVVLLNSASLSLLLALSAAESILLFALYVAVFRRDIAEAIRLGGSGRELRDVWTHCRSASPVFASGLLVLLLLNTDKLLVFRFMGQAESGLYNGAARLVDVLYFIPMVIGTTHAATFASMAPGGRLLPAYRGALLTATWASAAAAVALAVLARFVMPLVYGEPFEGGASVLTLLAPCLLAVTWVSLRTRALAALNQRVEILRLTLVACVIHFPLLAAGLWIGSIEAVALCQTAGWMIAAVVVPLASPTARGMSPLYALRTTS